MTFLSALKSLSCFGTANSRRRQEKPNVSSSNSSLIDVLPPLRPTKLPHVLPIHQEALSEQGWTTITYPNPKDPLLEASQALFTASRAFFALPQTYKEGFRTEKATEEGWTRVEGEKEFITLRNLENTPIELRDAATAYWKEAGGLLHETLGRVAESLGMPADSLTRYSGPCQELAGTRTATMLRLFRYEGFEGDASSIVAQPHKDLGLLSLVIGDTPGLEVWDRYFQNWFQIERTYEKPAASLLVGNQLQRLSNGRYMAGGHLVRSYPDHSLQGLKPSTEKKYRYSIVFVLRTHSPVMINTDNLTTSITGEFREPIRDVRAGDFFREIQKSRFNINATHEEREKQRLRLAEMKKQQQQQQQTQIPAEPANPNEKQ